MFTRERLGANDQACLATSTLGSWDESGWNGPQEASSPNPRSKEGQLWGHQVAQGFIQLSHKSLQGWRLYSLSGQRFSFRSRSCNAPEQECIDWCQVNHRNLTVRECWLISLLRFFVLSTLINTRRTNSFGRVQNKRHVIQKHLCKVKFSRESAEHSLFPLQLH